MKVLMAAVAAMMLGTLGSVLAAPLKAAPLNETEIGSGYPNFGLGPIQHSRQDPAAAGSF